jgi:hypothetical protein
VIVKGPEFTIQITLYVAEVHYVARLGTYQYQLKEQKDSATLYDGGKPFPEKDLDFA